MVHTTVSVISRVYTDSIPVETGLSGTDQSGFSDLVCTNLHNTGCSLSGLANCFFPDASPQSDPRCSTSYMTPMTPLPWLRAMRWPCPISTPILLQRRRSYDEQPHFANARALDNLAAGIVGCHYLYHIYRSILHPKHDAVRSS